jgi:hypothetical protein
MSGDGTTLTLGDIEFTGVELPERIPWGTEQQLATQKLVGGQRQLDAMGPDYKPIEWSGIFFGPNAEPRAKAVDAMCASGLVVKLAWSSFSYQVIVRSFEPVFERFYQIPYRISCEVQSNNVQPVTTSATPSLDDAVNADNATAQSLAAAIDDPEMNSLAASVNSMIAAA